MIPPEIFVGLKKTYEKLFKNRIKNLKSEYMDTVVCQAWNTTPEQVKTPSRKTKDKEPRQVCMAFRQIIKGESQDKTGAAFYRNHATALHAKRKVKDLYETEKDFREKIWKILRTLNIPPIYFHNKIMGINN